VVKRSGDSPLASAPSCLHLVAGTGREALDDCLLLSRAGDAVVFLDAGVLHLLDDAGAPVVGLAEVHYSAADLQAHGLLQRAKALQVNLVDDTGICALLAQHEHCLTWT
jgi:sulfur relay protein TusB/DsrH